MSMLRSVVLGCGSYLPERVVTKHELAKAVETSDEWITERTGIRERRIAPDSVVTSDLATAAAKDAIHAAGLATTDIDLPANNKSALEIVTRYRAISQQQVMTK